MKIYAGCDHAGLELKTELVGHLAAAGHEVIDLGTRTEDVTDYPDWAARVGRAVREDKAARGLIVCGSGVGVSIVANKMPGIRAIDAWNVESARLSREHNDTNVLCLGQRLIPPPEAKAILDAWLTAEFEHGRHVRRLVKIAALERGEGLEVAVERQLELFVRDKIASRVASRGQVKAPVDPAARAFVEAFANDAPTNPALALAAFLTAVAKQGRTHICVALAPEVAQLGPDLRSALAAAGSLAVEVVPGAALSPADVHADDRGFILLGGTPDAPAVDPRAVDALRMAGHPVLERLLERQLDSRAAAAGELAVWEFAAAVVAASFGAKPL